MHVWSVLHVARWKCRTPKIAKNLPSGHHRTTLSGYIFATKACIDNRKKNLLNSYISSTCPHHMVNFGQLQLRSVGEFGAPQQISTGFVSWQRYCTTLVVGVSQTLRHWTDGATYIWQGGHHVGHWPTFLVDTVLVDVYFCLVRTMTALELGD